jgi:hypothetical protein
LGGGQVIDTTVTVAIEKFLTGGSILSVANMSDSIN